MESANSGSLFAPARISPYATTQPRRCKSDSCMGWCEMVEVEPRIPTPFVDARDPIHASFSLYCEDCVTRIQAEEAAGEAKKDHQFLMAQRREWWSKVWKKDSSYHDTRHDRLPDQAAATKVLRWTHKHPKGVLCQGTTGSGKTRTVYLLLQGILFTHGVYPIIRKCVKLRAEIADAAREGDGARKALIAKLVNAPILFLDDLGQMANTPAAEEALLDIIEERSHLGKPVIATTQYSGDAFVRPFSNKERGEAIARRLADSCYVITFAAKTHMPVETEIPAL